MERDEGDETILAREGLTEMSFRRYLWGSPGGSTIKNPPANAEAWVQSLIPEDPTCREATKSMCHNY